MSPCQFPMTIAITPRAPGRVVNDYNGKRGGCSNDTEYILPAWKSVTKKKLFFKTNFC